MARRSSHKSDEQKTKEKAGPPSYPYVVYATWQPTEDPESMRWLILKFMKPWGARNMIESLRKNLFGGKYELKNRPSLNWHYMQFENGMQVSLRNNEQYTTVMELDFDESEAYVSDEVKYFKYRSDFKSVKSTGDTRPEENELAEPDRKTSKRSRNERSADAGPREPKPKSERSKVDRTGKISANDLANELGVAGREVRGVLRALKLVKPEGGWLFDEATANDIRAKVKSGLKKKK